MIILISTKQFVMTLLQLANLFLMTICPPLPKNTEMLSMLHSYESKLLLHNLNVSTQQVAFVVDKISKGK